MRPLWLLLLVWFQFCIAAADTPMDVAGYTFGAVLGGTTGIWLTKHWKDA